MQVSGAVCKMPAMLRWSGKARSLAVSEPTKSIFNYLEDLTKLTARLPHFPPVPPCRLAHYFLHGCLLLGNRGYISVHYHRTHLYTA